MSSAAAAKFSTKFTRTETTSIVITQDYSNENARAGDLNLSTRSNNYDGVLSTMQQYRVAWTPNF